MGGLLGPVGGLRELKCASSLEVEATDSSVASIVADLDGGEHVQLRVRRPSRVWQVGVGTARPEDMAALHQLERVQRGRSLFAYYPEDAQVENMLDPDASLMDVRRWTNVTQGGARVLPGSGLPGPRFEESAATSPDGTWAHLSNIPVPLERTITASIYLTPYVGMAAHFWVDELRMDGSTLRVYKASTPVATGANADETTLRRIAHTFTTSSETAAITFGVSRAATVVAPALTLTNAPLPWMVGAGCVSAVLMAPMSKNVQLAIPGVSWGSRSGHAWTVREIAI
nr:MAG TPA: hypothetical protein [Caudoviricetes sp.]